MNESVMENLSKNSTNAFTLSSAEESDILFRLQRNPDHHCIVTMSSQLLPGSASDTRSAQALPVQASRRSTAQEYLTFI